MSADLGLPSCLDQQQQLGVGGVREDEDRAVEFG
jgi:hypothetical protein